MDFLIDTIIFIKLLTVLSQGTHVVIIQIPKTLSQMLLFTTFITHLMAWMLIHILVFITLYAQVEDKNSKKRILLHC